MNGATRMLEVAAAAGAEVCFANPGTTELAIVAALDQQRAIRPVLTLFEGVATGAADGYGRIAERPALTLMHLGPGLSNGLANLHNARRARAPVVNLVGDHPAWLAALDPPLASDIAALARTVSAWLQTSSSGPALAAQIDAAFAAAGGWPGQVATLIVAADHQAEDAAQEYTRAHPPALPFGSAASPGGARLVDGPRVDGPRVDRARAVLASPSALLLGGAALREDGLRAAARIAAATGCRLLVESFPARRRCGQGLPALERIPYLPAMVHRLLAGVPALVLAGAEAPVPYFAEPTGPRSAVPEATSVVTLAAPTEDVVGALHALADALDAPARAVIARRATPPRPTRDALNGASVIGALAATLPADAIVIDEGVSHGASFLAVSDACPPHDYLSLTGGATGYGLPCALGAALAAPGRRVVALVGDGSAMYTIQALWSHAREGARVVTIVLANDGYRILQLEMMRRGGGASSALTDFAEPRIDWVGVARGLGVPATRVTSSDALLTALHRAFAEEGPHLIEARLH